ncbi:hypothetical protein [Brevifollis gellanilyticus]|uniref:SbsA Ig-like domain-containing protein n=1 Tax=Brevifollis gellanilyticus TaxID=748831 RepID=A0A512M1X9_9BACT|nr:hypothetical protein [Brevifollis gellanilyticus]GEP40729.1 hypothetical protein BGE01nite_00200 [Brevifollis gellanilyticus]
MHHKAADMRKLLVWLALPLVGMGVASLLAELVDGGGAQQPVSIGLIFPEDGARVELVTPVIAEPKLQVMLPSSNVPLLGRVETLADRFIFVPSLPFTPGQKYVVKWVDASGAAQQAEFLIKPTPQEHPTVRLAPQAVLPANALKFYLHFSEPMEQGIFLDRLRLLDGDGKEVIGPFRETELWSPDGKRLTVWFHPGRQKTGVNLNEDEGPVLYAKMKHTLVVLGSWRSTHGVALGKDVRFDFQVGDADHAQPHMKRWEISAPKSGTRESLVVHFDEPLDTAVITGALRVKSGASDVVLADSRVSADGLQWSATPQQPWPSATFELHAEPTLEDLAGNSLEKLFEVDVSETKNLAQPMIVRNFETH